MSIDLSQFHQTFMEESYEGLEQMENCLLNLEAGEADEETINTIFRAAHSIKGGSGTFGFDDIASFTHVLETLLDEMRSGQRQVTDEAVTVLLSSVDCVKEMLAEAQGGDEANKDAILEVQQRMESMLGNEAAGEESADSDSDNGSGVGVNAGWHIEFSPHAHLLKTGNDPVRMFRELEELGDMTVTVDSTRLPPLDELDSEECLLAWNIDLACDCDEAAVQEIFEWVDGDCDLEISALAAGSSSPAEEAVVVESVVAAAEEALTAGGEITSVEDKTVAAKTAKKPVSAETGSIRVGIDKIDTLINMVGELVITQSMLSQLGEDFDMSSIDRLRDGLGELERNTRELQENVMRIRMLPISFAFNRFPRLVHDLSAKLGKKIELRMAGEQTELDKTVMEKITDPLVHLVRNSLDHGIELPEDRKAAGKPEMGYVLLNAYHKGGNIIIEITDDGRGLNTGKILKKAIENGLVREGDNLPDEQVHDLIFQPGFSTADVVSDVSGRGVGMDVVRKNIKALGGTVEISSKEGQGSTISIRLPLTLAIMDGQLVRVGEQTYIIPLVSIIESLQASSDQVNEIAGKAEVYKLRDDYIKIVRLYEAFNIVPDNENLEEGLLVVVEGDGQKVGLMVDDLLGQQQIVIKSLETNYRRVDGVSGATILGDGTVALILDVSGLIDLAQRGGSRITLPRAV